MKALRSKRYRDASRGMPCTLQMPGCTGGGEDTVFAHIHDRHTGRSIKASDISGCDACSECHDRFDLRRKMLSGSLISDSLWLFYALRGIQRTLEARVEAGVLGWPSDKSNTSPKRVRKSAETEHEPKPRPMRSANRLPGRVEVKMRGRGKP